MWNTVWAKKRVVIVTAISLVISVFQRRVLLYSGKPALHLLFPSRSFERFVSFDDVIIGKEESIFSGKNQEKIGNQELFGAQYTSYKITTAEVYELNISNRFVMNSVYFFCHICGR